MPQVAQGGTVRLLATFEDATGALTDPVTPVVDILDPSNTEVVTDDALTRDSLGQYHYDFAAAADAPLGSWTARFSGVINGAEITGEDPFTVLAPGSVGVGEPWLVQLSEVKTALYVDPTDTRKDDLYTSAISAASRAILNYTERDFASPLVTETREFTYDGSGFLDIDDANNITAVAMKVPNSSDVVLDEEVWTAMPAKRDDSPVFTYLLIPNGYPSYPSVAMGFERNLDTFVADHGYSTKPQTVAVTAEWGWPEVPADVKRAAIWTIRDWTSDPKGDSRLQSESIAGYSRSWAQLGGLGMLAIPNAARDLLASYQRLHG